MDWSVTHRARVENVLVTAFGQDVGSQVSSLTVTAGEGIKGDRHCGGQRLSDNREVLMKHIGVGLEVPVANVRQWSAIDSADLAVISQGMATPELIPVGLLGENLVLSDVEGPTGLTQVPSGSLMTFAAEGKYRKTVLAVWGENFPCSLPARNIQAHFGADWQPVERFQQASSHRRGLVGYVYCSGKIKVGDQVEIWKRQAQD